MNARKLLVDDTHLQFWCQIPATAVARAWISGIRRRAFLFLNAGNVLCWYIEWQKTWRANM